jgi:hypothetical protein
MHEYEEVGGMTIGRGKRSTRRNGAALPLCPPQIQNDMNWDRGGKPATNRLLWHDPPVFADAEHCETFALACSVITMLYQTYQLNEQRSRSVFGMCPSSIARHEGLLPN